MLKISTSINYFTLVWFKLPQRLKLLLKLANFILVPSDGVQTIETIEIIEIIQIAVDLYGTNTRFV